MGKIMMIKSETVARKVVNDILTNNTPVIAVSFKQVLTEKNGAIVYMIVGTYIGQVFMFDIKENKTLIHEGQLWRLLESTELTKVIHDCRAASAALKSQFSVTLRNIFDTQAYYSLYMLQHHLPARWITLASIYDKFGDPDKKYAQLLWKSPGRTLFDWAQRPLPKELSEIAAAEVLALVPGIYANIKRETAQGALPYVEDLTHAYIHGKFMKSLKTKNRHIEKPSASKKKTLVLNLTEEKLHLLKDTTPISLFE